MSKEEPLDLVTFGNFLLLPMVHDTKHKDFLIDGAIEVTSRAKTAEKALNKIKEAYENGDENKLDEVLYGLFSNEPVVDEAY